jgi:hypothetical protein
MELLVHRQRRSRQSQGQRKTMMKLSGEVGMMVHEEVDCQVESLPWNYGSHCAKHLLRSVVVFSGSLMEMIVQIYLHYCVWKLETNWRNGVEMFVF